MQSLVDQELSQKLGKVNGPVELRDESGRAVGWFYPTFAPPVPSLDSPISQEELERRKRLGGGRPLSEILKDLENR